MLWTDPDGCLTETASESGGLVVDLCEASRPEVRHRALEADAYASSRQQRLIQGMAVRSRDPGRARCRRQARVALFGDAAFCVSLLAGQGSALAMVSAYILAGELHRCNGDYAEAFRRYQHLFGPFCSRETEGRAALSLVRSYQYRYLHSSSATRYSISWRFLGLQISPWDVASPTKSTSRITSQN
jgi:2-polyprenyl-6-methoxyphenol hydroxylase-like FAD-dependent oxidoreductase